MERRHNQRANRRPKRHRGAMKRLAMWAVWNVPMGWLAPLVLGYAFGSHPKRVMQNDEVSGAAAPLTNETKSTRTRQRSLD